MKSFVGNLANKRNSHTNFSGGKWGNNRTTVKLNVWRKNDKTSPEEVCTDIFANPAHQTRRAKAKSERENAYVVGRQKKRNSCKMTFRRC